MDNKNFYILTIIILTILLTGSFYQSTILAQGNSFSHVVPIDAGQGFIRFFDTSTGILYTYDRTLQNVTDIVQIEKLGEPAKEILSPSQETSFRYIEPDKKH